MKELKIDFDHVVSREVIHDYAKAGKNYLQVEISLPDGRTIIDRNSCVNITMSQDAMIALGLHLLNAAYNADSTENGHRLWEWFPAYKDGILNELGVAMHPESCELKLFENNSCESIFKLVGQGSSEERK